MKKIIFLVLIIIYCATSVAQSNLTIEETIDYINNKLKEKPIMSDGNKTINSIELSQKNGFMIHEYYYELDYLYSMDEITANIKTKCFHYVKILNCDYKNILNNLNKNANCSRGNYGLDPNNYIELEGEQFECWKAKNCQSNILTVKTKEGKYESFRIGYDNTDPGIFGPIEIEKGLSNKLCNAFIHLFEKIIVDPRYQKNPRYKTMPNDPFENGQKVSSSNNANPLLEGTNSETIKYKKMDGGTFEIPVIINGVLKINFIFDSGASDVSISPDVALTLIRTGTVKESDFIGSQRYTFADGSSALSQVFIIREIQLGKHKIYNIRASISNSINAPMLLGQSVLEEFGKITIDNKNQQLIIEK